MARVLVKRKSPIPGPASEMQSLERRPQRPEVALEPGQTLWRLCEPGREWPRETGAEQQQQSHENQEREEGSQRLRQSEAVQRPRCWLQQQIEHEGKSDGNQDIAREIGDPEEQQTENTHDREGLGIPNRGDRFLLLDGPFGMSSTDHGRTRIY